MYEPALTAAGSGVGGAAGAVPGVLGRSPLLDLLRPLDYPRQALWNLVRGPARFAQGEGSLDDILGMVPGLAGAGMAALGPLGLLGGALAGGAVQGLGKLTGSEAFEASTPQDVTGSEDFLPNLAVGAATDPLTYAGLGLGGQAGRQAGRRLASEAAGPSILFEPGALARTGLPEGSAAGIPVDQLEGAARAGLAGRNQALGEAVGQLAQQPRPQPFLDEVLAQGRANDLGPGGQAVPGATPLGPEQAFGQMLPDYQRLQKIEAAQADPRNALPGMLTDYPEDQLRRAASEPTRRLIGDWRDNAHAQNAYLDPLGYRALPAAEAQGLRRWRAVQDAGRSAGRQFADKWGPLTVELEKAGQLGPIESRLQANWAMLGDQINEGALRQADILSGIERNLTEDEAFQMLFERSPAGMPGGPAAWSGQQAALDHLLEGIGQAHPGLAGEPAAEIVGSLSGAPEAGAPRFLGRPPQRVPLTEFGGRPVAPEQVQQALLAQQLEGRLNTAARHHAIMAPGTEGLYDRIAAMNGPVPHNFWEPAAAAESPASSLMPPGPAFPGEFAPGPAFPPLPEALAQASQQVGQPLQPWEMQQLEQALAQRNPAPLQERGLLGTGEVPGDVSPPMPRGVSMEVHNMTGMAAAPDLRQAMAQLPPGVSPFGALGLHRLEQMLGRDLTEADLQFLESINR